MEREADRWRVSVVQHREEGFFKVYLMKPSMQPARQASIRPPQESTQEDSDISRDRLI